MFRWSDIEIKVKWVFGETVDTKRECPFECFLNVFGVREHLIQADFKDFTWVGNDDCKLSILKQSILLILFELEYFWWSFYLINHVVIYRLHDLLILFLIECDDFWLIWTDVIFLIDRCWRVKTIRFGDTNGDFQWLANRWIRIQFLVF